MNCIDGGFDLTQVTNVVIRNNRGIVKGELSCEGL
jgi:hypothetical protein